MKRKAFTLTELLVVVVIIGVLSAVVLPKFTKVLGSLKTSEAEEMMTAVRNEQEARCSISKNYTEQFSKLRSYRAGKNYDYQINSEGVGMIAKAKSGKYTLEIPSYVDGRICCNEVETGGCASLNKSYPTCEELKAKADYAQGNKECEAPVPSCDNSHQEGEEASNAVCECGGPRREEWTCQGTEWVKKLVQDCGTCTCGDEPTDPPAPTKDEDGCTTTYEWEKTDAPVCWEKKQVNKECPKGMSTCAKGIMSDNSGSYRNCEYFSLNFHAHKKDKVIEETSSEKQYKETCCVTTCGDWEDPTTGTSGEYFCSKKNYQLSSQQLEKVIVAENSDQYVAQCCSPCPLGTQYLGNGQCGSCSDLGSNYYWNGAECVQRFTVMKLDGYMDSTEMPQYEIGENYYSPDIKIYASFKEKMEGCKRTLTPIGETISQCSEDFEKNLLVPNGLTQYCENCNADNGTCGAFACYRYADLVRAQKGTLNDWNNGGTINRNSGLYTGNYSSSISSNSPVPFGKKIVGMEGTNDVQFCNAIDGKNSLASILLGDNQVACGYKCSDTISVAVHQACPSTFSTRANPLIVVNSVYEGTVGRVPTDEKVYFDKVKAGMNWNHLANILQAYDPDASNLGDWLQQNTDVKAGAVDPGSNEAKLWEQYQNKGHLSENYDNPVAQEYMWQRMQDVLKEQWSSGDDKISYFNFCKVMNIDNSDGYTHSEWFLTNKLFAGQDVALEYDSFEDKVNGDFDMWENRYEAWANGESGWLDSDAVTKENPPAPPSIKHANVNVCVEKYLIKVPIYKCSRGYAYEGVNNPAPTNY